MAKRGKQIISSNQPFILLYFVIMVVRSVSCHPTNSVVPDAHSSPARSRPMCAFVHGAQSSPRRSRPRGTVVSGCIAVGLGAQLSPLHLLYNRRAPMLGLGDFSGYSNHPLSSSVLLRISAITEVGSCSVTPLGTDWAD